MDDRALKMKSQWLQRLLRREERALHHRLDALSQPERIREKGVAVLCHSMLLFECLVGVARSPSPLEPRVLQRPFAEEFARIVKNKFISRSVFIWLEIVGHGTLNILQRESLQVTRVATTFTCRTPQFPRALLAGKEPVGYGMGRGRICPHLHRNIWRRCYCAGRLWHFDGRQHPSPGIYVLLRIRALKTLKRTVEHFLPQCSMPTWRESSHSFGPPKCTGFSGLE